MTMRQPDYSLSPVLNNFTPADLDRLVGKGKKANLGRLVRRVVDEVKSAASAESWPLNRIEVELYQDPEVANWEYLVVLLVFDNSFDEFDKANQYLEQLYHRLEGFSQGLTGEALDLFRRLIYFDIASA